MTEYDTDIDAPPIHIVCGLPFESRSIRRALPTKSFRLWFSGADAGRARELALAAAASAPAGLISFGLAGGVDPALAPGSLVIPTDVIDAKRQLHPVTGLWRTALLAAAKANRMEVESGLLAGVTRVAATPAEKARLWVERQAAAVHMESLAAAEPATALTRRPPANCPTALAPDCRPRIRRGCCPAPGIPGGA